jgi:hypothetical protein
MPDDDERQKFWRVGSFSREEASAVLDATLAMLPKETASDAAVAAVKVRVVPLTMLAKRIGCPWAELRDSTIADLRARAKAWASAFEAVWYRCGRVVNVVEGVLPYGWCAHLKGAERAV